MQPNPPLPPVEQLEVFQAILEGIDDAIFVKDTSGHYVVVNSPAAKFIGKPAKDIIGKTDLELFERDKALQMAERDRLAMRRGAGLSFEETALVGGVTRTFVTTIGPWTDHHGLIMGVFARAREITDQK